MIQDLIPANWETGTLGTLVVVERGSSPRPIKNFITNVGGVNWIKIGDMKEGQKFVVRTAERITEEGASKSRFVGVGDFILSNSMSFGRPYIMAIEGYIHDGWFALRLPSLIDSEYFYYLLSSSLVQDQFQLLAVGGVVKNISGDLVKQAVLPLPPLTEQKVIANKLDTLLAQVDNTKARLERIPEILKRFRQSVLAAAVSGKLTEEWREDKTLSSDFYSKMIELPADVKRGGKQAIKGVLDLGKAWLPSLPSCWVYKSVDSLYKSNHLLDYVDGNHGTLYPRSDEFTDDGVLFVTATQIGDGELVDWNAVPRLNNESAKKLTKGWAKNGDVLLTHNATVGRTAFVSDCIDEQFLLGTSATLYRTEDNRINRKYLYHFLSSRIWQSQLEAVMEQSTRNQVSITKQALMSVSLPPLEEQTRNLS